MEYIQCLSYSFVTNLIVVGSRCADYSPIFTVKYRSNNGGGVASVKPGGLC